MSKDKKFEKYLKEAKQDPNVLGFIVSGGRGKGQFTKYSDYDIEIIVKDNVAKKYHKRYEQISDDEIGFSVHSLSGFKTYLNTTKSEFEWDRYNFSHLKAMVDKTGKVQKILDEKGKIPKNEVKKYVSGYLDGYINYVYRSLKCWRDKNSVGARLEAARSINYLLLVIFGIEGRPAPYYKFLEWELKNYPLKKVKIGAKELVRDLLRILEKGDAKTQQGLLRKIEKIVRREGYGKVFDSWGSSWTWMKTWSKK